MNPTSGQPRRTKRDIIVDEMRALIDSGELPRGVRVHQDELAMKFNTSITPVREALRLLEAEGLLIGEPHRGVRVASADLQQVKATYITRRLLEPYAMMRAARRISLMDREEAARLIARAQEAFEQSDAATILDLNRRFHFLFYERVGMPSLTGRIEALWRDFPWDILNVVTQRREQSIEEHRAILRAVESGDSLEVAATTEAHIRHSYSALVRHFGADAQGDPFDIDVD